MIPNHGDVRAGRYDPLLSVSKSGSRERYKWVMEYDSYRFTSARWSLIAYHFVKLDTWLEGICQPEHPEWWSKHPKARKPTANASLLEALDGMTADGEDDLTWDSKKYSIFAVADGDDCGDDDDEQAGEDDDL
jgi:hypothetical protein